MSPVPASAIVIVDDGIIIDAEVLAPKLGLSAEALKGEMRKGIVYSVVETGVDEDAGRIRLTLRYRTRAWTVVVEPDGTLVESAESAAKAPPAHTDRLKSARTREDRVMTAAACDVGRAAAGEGNSPETLARRLRTHLQVVAKQRVPITYQEAVNAVRLTAPNTITK